MKKPILLMLIMMLVVGSSALAVVTLPEDDLSPAGFRGQAGTTLQAWYFDNEASPVDADPSENPYGTPTAEVSVIGSGAWLADYMGEQGVFRVDRSEGSDMILEVPNVPEPNPVKHLWLQLVYYAEEGMLPNIYVVPGYGDDADWNAYERLELVESQTLDSGYTHATFQLSIEPNPEWEYIFIRPRDCEVYVDSVILETQCIPEPMTMLLLGAGSMLLRLRRKQ